MTKLVTWPICTVLVALVSGGCGTTEYREESYTCDIDYTPGENNAWVLIGSLKKKEKSSKFNHTKWSRKAPYTMRLLVHATDDSKTPVRLLSAQLEHQGETIVLHDRKDPPIEQMLAKHDVHKGTPYYETEIPIELWDDLKWVKGSKCTTTVVVEVPWQDEELTIETQYEATERDEEGHDLDGLMGV